MSQIIRCPDCGHENPAGSTACAACHFPLVEIGTPEPQAVPAAAEPVPMLRPIRPRRPRASHTNLPLTLWLGFGTFMALVLAFVALKGFNESNAPPVEGSSPAQQEQANALRAILAKDSTDTRAQVGLADILFDTGNWSEAIVHYRSALRQDSSLVTAIVDMGVCYYNLSQPQEAERLFRRALRHDPHQPFALFNLGIVYERRNEPQEALKYFHSALQSAPPETMKPALLEAMQRVSEQTGKTAPPLNSPQ